MKKALWFVSAVTVMIMFAVFANAKISDVSVTQSKKVGSCGENVSVTVNGGTSGMKYKFVYMKDNWKSWGVIKELSTGNSADFTTKIPGDYKIYVDILDTNGDKDTKILDYKVSSVPSLTLPTACNAGDSVSVKGSSIADGATYKFVYMRNNWQDWGVIQNFGSNKNVNFIPQKTGDCYIYLDVKDKYGNVESTRQSISVTHGIKPTISADSTVITKQGLKISSASSGKTEGAQYKFVYMRNNWKDWGVIQGFSTNSSTTYSFSAAGSYKIYMDVKDKYDNIVSVSKDVTVTEFKGELKLSSDNVDIGTEVNLTGSSNGSNPTYKFVYMRNNWADWGVIQKASEKNSATFTPKYPGEYHIYMDVQDEYGNTLTVYKKLNKAGISAKSLAGLTEKQVIETIGPLCTKDQKNSDILASVTMAQFILESGYGKTELAQNANNCFGMKVNLSGNTWSGSTWDGKSKYTKYTYEQDANGNQYQISADFRKYPCIDDSLADHSAYLLGAKNGSKLRYAGLKGEKDYRKAITIIKNGGYATDVNYINKICNIIERWDLTRFDLKK